MTNKFIAIEGVIGVGKTTLARLIQPTFNASILLEVFEENPFLADFYHDRGRYAFQTQLFFLLSRYQQQKQAIPEALTTGNVVADYTFAKDELFAWLNLKDDELAMYGRVHSALSEKIRPPDLLVYLKAEHETIMQRIASRDRPYERDMDPEYIRQLASAYEAWLNGLQEIPVLVLDVTHLDFLANKADLAHVIAEIEQALTNAPVPPAKKRPSDEPAAYLHAHGALTNYQQFHRKLDAMKGFDEDLFFNYILLVEEMGEVASEFAKIWAQMRRGVASGRYPEAALSEAIASQRPSLRRELADMLAYTIKLANYTGINLEEAYLEKMRENIDRQCQ
ncbi:MAG: deoxynucleoside kinase [Chloroflexi bacterium]|nr:deoxynucleoside kinase [Chloroflexota bacterium]